MFKKIGIAAAAVVAILLSGLFALVTIGLYFAEGSAAGSTGSGRAISVTANSPVINLQTGADTATIRTLRQTIIVKPTQVLLNGHPIATIPKDAKSVNIRVHDGEITLVADGQQVSTSRY